MSLTETYYHSTLRVTAVLCCATLLFVGGYINPATKQISMITGEYLAAAVGASASVEPTVINMMTAGLTAQRMELEEREQVVAQRELSLNLGATVESNPATDVSSFVLSALLFVLLVLIVLNYILDFLRATKEVSTIQQVTQ